MRASHRILTPKRCYVHSVHDLQGTTPTSHIYPSDELTFSLLARHCWWPAMTSDIKELVSACSVCAQSKSSHQPPLGAIGCLPVSGFSWSHLALELMTRRPHSKSKSVILSIVGRFSKAVHVIALAKLPSAMKTKIMVDQVFRVHQGYLVA